MSKEEALQYLKLRTIDEEQAVQIYKLTSGRMIHLKFIADHIKIISTLEGTCIVCYSDVIGLVGAESDLLNQPVTNQEL